MGNVAAENDLVILDNILESKRNDYNDKKDNDFFQFFVAQQILKKYNIRDDEVESGIVDNSGDSGIDGFYLFVNDELDQEGAEYDHHKSNINIELLIIQATRHRGFKESAVEHFLTASTDIFKLETDLSTDTYHEQLLKAIRRFHSVYAALISKRATFNVCFFYASKGSMHSPSINHKVDKLKETVSRYMPTAKFSFKFLGANELIELNMASPPLPLTLRTVETPMTSSRGGYVCLVGLYDFFNFVTDDDGVLQTQLFEANVRDYQGKVEVNKAMQASLDDDSNEDFWWLNNGVSVVATDVTPNYKTLTIHDPQIVNGLQTTRQICNYFNRTSKTDSENRCILVRVMIYDGEESLNRIIKATNSQTAVPISSLRSTDPTHRKIELHLKKRGLFYDRRKNYYKNAGKPRNKIVGISKLAQAMMAIVLRRPDLARSRPSTLLKKDEEYNKLFGLEYPLDLYYVCIEGVRQVESRMRALDPSIVSKRDRQNLKFYVAMHVIAGVGKSQPKPEKIAKFDVSSLDEVTVRRSLDYILPKYKELGADDTVVKSSRLLKAILNTE